MQPWVGASWEGFVIAQVLATLAATGRRVDPYFLRTSDGYEIDLLLELGRERWAIEVTLTSQPEPRDLERLDRVADAVRAGKRIVVCKPRQPVFSARRVSCDLASLLVHLREASIR